jgi:hypothetical protein
MELTFSICWLKSNKYWLNQFRYWDMKRIAWYWNSSKHSYRRIDGSSIYACPSFRSIGSRVRHLSPVPFMHQVAVGALKFTASVPRLSEYWLCCAPDISGPRYCLTFFTVPFIPFSNVCIISVSLTIWSLSVTSCIGSHCITSPALRRRPITRFKTI